MLGSRLNRDPYLVKTLRQGRLNHPLSEEVFRGIHVVVASFSGVIISKMLVLGLQNAREARSGSAAGKWKAWARVPRSGSGSLGQEETEIRKLKCCVVNVGFLFTVIEVAWSVCWSNSVLNEDEDDEKFCLWFHFLWCDDTHLRCGG